MIYKGKQLFVTVDDQVLMASKSCSVSIKADTVAVSSATDADWEHSLPGRKSWSVSTNHLLRAISRDSSLMTTFEAMSKSWMEPNVRSYCKVGSDVRYHTTRGLMLLVYKYANGAWSYYYSNVYDTYTNGCQSMVADIENQFDASSNNDKMGVIISHDAYELDQDLVAAINTYMSVPVNLLPYQAATQGAFVAIGGPAITGIAQAQTGRAGYAHASLNTIAGSGIGEPALKTFALKVGSTVRLRMTVDGYPSDSLGGYANVTSFQVQSTNGNLMTGSFQFEGSGPLE